MCTSMFFSMAPLHHLGLAGLRSNRPPTSSTSSACDLPASSPLISSAGFPGKLLLIPPRMLKVKKKLAGSASRSSAEPLVQLRNRVLQFPQLRYLPPSEMTSVVLFKSRRAHPFFLILVKPFHFPPCPRLTISEN
jgi:hypothetical protein